MVKRLVAGTVAAIILLLPFQVTAESKYSLTYERSIALMNLNNGTLKKLERAENDALRDYKSNLQSAQNIDVNGFTFTFMDKESYILYDNETKLMMRKVKELYPEQMKFVWEAAQNNRLITDNSLKATLRSVFFGVYNAAGDIKLKQKQLELTKTSNSQNKIKLQKGMITALDLEESDYNLTKAQIELDNASRNYENAVRSFNQFTGLPAKTQYTDIIFEDKLTDPKLKSVDYYIEQALSNRFEITSLKKQLALKVQERDIIESFNIYKFDATAQDEHESLLNDIDQLGIDLESTKLTISNEIRNAYVDVVKAGKNANSVNNTLKLQQSNYNKMQSRYKAGMISKNVLDQAELGLRQVENGYRAALFDYNTRIIRFNNATGIGPAY